MRIKTSGLHIEIGVVYKTLTNVTSALIIVYNTGTFSKDFFSQSAVN